MTAVTEFRAFTKVAVEGLAIAEPRYVSFVC
jgi:hypothetical protein